ncbi:ABC transporter substrate-binding protein [Conexibacter stalactiti]|uniref:ABC transporter substrate-binding protein n=1 Tax=Conexibacter stalactiti TaxID=1940611 RepID=A0ABU4HU46_9ACTN|nr:ABC transporter substrate-binding protein [Conexibacter stalactiti]MDW5596838.1 ABC transporter substrate-binding protein [Conexibacter stalactiti]MEC5037480.1 ABC transporter substrate-binding protein [Conexibacter stalactiti]
MPTVRTRRRGVAPPHAILRLLLPLLLLAAVATTSGCGSSDGSGGATAATTASADADALPSGGRAVDGGTLTYAADTEPEHLDPGVAGTDAAALAVRNVVDSLVAQSLDGEPLPWLASEWTVSDDGRVYEFRLRDGVRFHDGEPFDAAAVKANFDRLLGPQESPGGAQSLVEPIKRVTVVDPSTVRFTLKRPYAPFLTSLSHAFLGIVSPAQLAGDRASLPTRPIGTGPFRVVKWNKGSDLTLERNPDYAWAPEGAANQGPPHLDQVVFRYLPEGSVRAGTLTSGQADVALSIPPVALDGIARNPRLAVSRYDDPGANYVLFLNTRKAPTDDVRVRQALLHAIDVEPIVRSLYRGAFAAPLSILSPTTLGYTPVESAVAYDPDLSARLLDEAGWSERDADGYRVKDGRRLRLDWPTVAEFQARDDRTTFQQLVQSAARRAGFELDLRPTPNTKIVTPMVGGDYNALDFSNKSPDPDILYDLFGSRRTLDQGGANMSKFADPEVDRWLAEGQASQERGAREAAYAQVQERLLEQAVALPFYVHPTIVGVGRHVRGLEWTPAASLSLQGAWLER